MDANMLAMLGALQDTGDMVEGAEEGMIEMDLLVTLAHMVRAASGKAGVTPRQFFENALSMARSMMDMIYTNPFMKDMMMQQLQASGAEIPENVETVVQHMDLDAESLIGNIVKQARMSLAREDLTEDQFEELSWLVQQLDAVPLN